MSKAKGLTTAEKFYVEQHPDQPDEQVARDIGVDAALVRKHRQATAAAPGLKLDGYAVKGGSVIMTPERSMADDVSSGRRVEPVSPPPVAGKPSALDAYRNNIHKIDPSKPCR
jgi:hypothetical protein